MARRRNFTRNLNPRLIVAGVVILGLVALVVNGIVSAAQSSSSYVILVNQSFGLQANSIFSAQSIEGQQLGALLVNMPDMERSTLTHELDSLAQTTAASSVKAGIAKSPEASNGVSSGVATAVAQRATAVGMIQHAVEGLLGLTTVPGSGSSSALLTTSQATTELTQAGVLLQQADNSIPPLRTSLASAPGNVKLNRSVFILDHGLLTAGAMGSLVASLEASSTLAVTHRLELSSVLIQPAPLPTASAPGAITISPTVALKVTTVISNQGNVGENPVVATVKITPVDGGIAGTSSASGAVAAGGALSLALTPLRTIPGTTVTLTISIAPAPGQTEKSGLSQTYTVKIAPSTTPTSRTP